MHVTQADDLVGVALRFINREYNMQLKFGKVTGPGGGVADLMRLTDQSLIPVV